MKYLIVTTATDSIDEARKIAEGLVRNKLASSVHINKVEGFYTWQNKFRNAEEYLLSARTKNKLFKQVKEFIEANHHYDLAEVLAHPIKKGSKEFLNWIDENTTD
jgi:periplasmic divalent cation tolerance protein